MNENNGESGKSPTNDSEEGSGAKEAPEVSESGADNGEGHEEDYKQEPCYDKKKSFFDSIRYLKSSLLASTVLDISAFLATDL